MRINYTISSASLLPELAARPLSRHVNNREHIAICSKAQFEIEKGDDGRVAAKSQLAELGVLREH